MSIQSGEVSVHGLVVSLLKEEKNTVKISSKRRASCSTEIDVGIGRVNGMGVTHLYARGWGWSYMLIGDFFLVHPYGATRG